MKGSEDGVFFWTNKNTEKAIPALHKRDVNKNHIKNIGTHPSERAFCRHSLRGSMTVEAAVVVPMVFFVWIACMALTSVVKIYENVQNALTNTALEMSVSSGDDADAVRHTGKLMIMGCLMNFNNLETGAVTYVHGFDFFESSILENEREILLKVKYYVQIMEGLIPIPEIKLSNQVYVRAWTGYLETENLGESLLGQFNDVYVSEYGQVYHTDPMCSHIRLKIFMVSENRAKHYEPCDKCIRTGIHRGNTYYITATGECYHSRLGCSGLKRNIDCMMITEAKTRGFRPCSRCAGGE